MSTPEAGSHVDWHCPPNRSPARRRRPAHTHTKGEKRREGAEAGWMLGPERAGQASTPGDSGGREVLPVNLKTFLRLSFPSSHSCVSLLPLRAQSGAPPLSRGPADAHGRLRIGWTRTLCGDSTPWPKGGNCGQILSRSPSPQIKIKTLLAMGVCMSVRIFPKNSRSGPHSFFFLSRCVLANFNNISESQFQ